VSIRIVLADDHTLVRQGLRKILEGQPDWQVVAEAADGDEAVRYYEQQKPDVVVLDVAMPRLNGIDAIRAIRRVEPRARILVLSMYIEEAYVCEALEAGATGYLLKDSADVDLLRAVSDTSQGRTFVSPAVAALMRDDAVRRRGMKMDRYERLSRREREVFRLIGEGRSNKEIAGLLLISLRTVETHRARVIDKLDLHSAAEIVRDAARRGLIH
jgi:DNA-binding NarL/FixJ family response regulator